jgi:exonuclease VII small subunit
MFISRADKQRIEQSITDLLAIVEKMNDDIVYLSAKVKVLEGGGAKKKRTMSPEARAKISQMMKERHAKNRLEKNK